MSKKQLKEKRGYGHSVTSQESAPPKPPPPAQSVDPVVEAARAAGEHIPDNLSAENPGVPTAPGPIDVQLQPSGAVTYSDTTAPGTVPAASVAPETETPHPFETGPPPHPWDDVRRMVADIERHAKHSHGLTPDTALFTAIADYIRQSWGVTEEEVPKP